MIENVMHLGLYERTGIGFLSETMDDEENYSIQIEPPTHLQGYEDDLRSLRICW
jgi:hypothetical protein